MILGIFRSSQKKIMLVLCMNIFLLLIVKNEAMAGVDEIDCEPNDNLVVNDHMDLGEEYFYS